MAYGPQVRSFDTESGVQEQVRCKRVIADGSMKWSHVPSFDDSPWIRDMAQWMAPIGRRVVSTRCCE